MTAEDSARRASNYTSGSSERAPQHLTDTVLLFDLDVEAAQLHYERGFREGDRNANTLVKADGFRVVLTALRAGARLEPHKAAGHVTVHVLSGRLRLRLPDQTVELPAGHLLVLEPDVVHDAEALEDSTFLLTLGL